MKTVLDASNMLPPIHGGAASPLALRLGSKPANVSFETISSLLDYEKEFPELVGLSRKDQIDYMRRKHDELKAKIDADDVRRAEIGERLDFLKGKSSVVNAVSDWGLTDLKLEKPAGPLFRALRRDVADGKTVAFFGDPYHEVEAKEYEKEVFRFAEVFLIEHDWAAAFNSADIGDATVKLPYEVCAFEFQFSGHSVIALATQFETSIVFTPAIFWEGKWLMTDCCMSLGNIDKKDRSAQEGIWQILVRMEAQIRAVCVALDAEVATSTVICEPHLSNHGRNIHQALKPYHVVSLAHRGPRPLPSASMIMAGV